MSHKVERVKDEQIILISLYGEHLAPEIPGIQQETAQLASGMPGKIVRIVDFSESRMSFSDVVLALQEGTKKREGSVADERFMSVYIATDAMSKLLAESLSQPHYGGLHVDVFSSVDEGLKFAREKLKQG